MRTALLVYSGIAVKMMVDSQLRPSKVSDPRILAAMGALPTERAATDPTVVGSEYYGPDGLFEQSGTR